MVKQIIPEGEVTPIRAPKELDDVDMGDDDFGIFSIINHVEVLIRLIRAAEDKAFLRQVLVILKQGVIILDPDQQIDDGLSLDREGGAPDMFDVTGQIPHCLLKMISQQQSQSSPFLGMGLKQNRVTS